MVGCSIAWTSTPPKVAESVSAVKLLNVAIVLFATAEVAALIEATTRTLADVTVRLMSAGATPSSEAARRCLKLAGAKSDTLP